jgi:hypothetical protein
MTTTRTPTARRSLLRGRRAVAVLLAGAGVALTPLPAQADWDRHWRGSPPPAAAPAPAPAPAPAAAPAPASSGKPTATSTAYSAWDPHVRPVVKEVMEKYSVSTVLTRPGHSPTQGRAADFMVYTDRSKGDAVAQYAIDNAARFGVEYVIWRQRIYMISSGSWRGMEDRGSATANHMDHVHVAFRSAK